MTSLGWTQAGLIELGEEYPLGTGLAPAALVELEGQSKLAAMVVDMA